MVLVAQFRARAAGRTRQEEVAQRPVAASSESKPWINTATGAGADQTLSKLPRCTGADGLPVPTIAENLGSYNHNSRRWSWPPAAAAGGHCNNGKRKRAATGALLFRSLAAMGADPALLQ